MIDFIKGFGTNFHKIYIENAKLYNDFSSAEIFSTELSQKIESLFVGEVALDVGAGTCHKTNIFSSFFDKIYGLDPSKELLDFARDKNSNNRKIEYLLASADHIPLLDNSVDVIISTWASLPLEEAISEMKRVCKPNGNIIRIGTTVIDEFTSMFPEYSMDRINYVNEYFRNQGFVEEVHDVLIKFEDLQKAKNILSLVLGIDKDLVLKSEYVHEVVLHYKKNVKIQR